MLEFFRVSVFRIKEENAMIRLKEIDMEHYDNMKGQLEKLMEEKAKLEAKINEKKDRIEKERYRLTQ